LNIVFFFYKVVCVCVCATAPNMLSVQYSHRVLMALLDCKLIQVLQHIWLSWKKCVMCYRAIMGVSPQTHQY